MGYTRLAAALGIALGFVLIAFSPAPVGTLHAAPAADGPYALFDAWVADGSPYLAVGARVVADYENGFVLLRLPSAVVADLSDAPGLSLVSTHVDVYFSGYGFDSALGEPAVPAALQASGSDAHLLQFVGPIRGEWVASLERSGLSFEQYLDRYAFVVRGTPQALAAAAASPYVRWTGAYHPAYKVAPALLERSGTVGVTVIAFSSVAQEALAERVAAIGGTVSSAWSYPSTVIADVPASRLADLARSPEVLSVQEYFVALPMDKTAGQIHKYHSAWYTQRTGLTSTLTGRSPGPDGVMYTSDDFYEGAGIMDTGFDEGDPNDGTLDFFDSPNGDRVIRLFRHAGPTADGKCGSAHGTHVAGIVAADGYSWERYLIENVGDTSVSVTDKEWHKSEAGVAPEAKISLDGVQNGNDLFCSGGLAVSLAYWDCQYLNGYITATLTAGVSSAVCGVPWIDGANVATHNTAIDAGSRTWVAINTNSWGDGSRAYGGTASGADTRMNSWPERLVVIAAGNDGPEPNTVSGTALGKNGLTIAASQNFRPEQFESDNPNLIAGFSGRGGPGESLGRIKPDLTAIGTSVVSLFARGETLSTGFTPGADLITQVDKYCSLTKNYCAAGDAIPDYRYLQGTSMATPHAAGLAILVREYLREVAAGNNPTSPLYNPPAYLVKAIMVNGAVRMDPNLYDYPGYDQGWGRIDLEQSLFPPVPRTNQFEIGEFTTSGTWSPASMNLNVVSGDVPLKATLVWLDQPGDALARNLDLRIRSPSGAEYHGNQYTNGWSDPTKTQYDNVNTVEQVEVEVPESGTWTVEVRGVSIPTAAKFALVFSADVGPQAQYKVDLRTTSPTAVSLAPNGSATIPLTALNYGTVADTVQLSSNAPAGLTVTYYPSNALPLQSTESQDVLAVISASAGITPGIYEFDLRAVSANDPSPTPASDFIGVRVEVLSSALPFPLQITNGTVDELDPSVLTFNDPAVGSQIFIAYRKTSKVSANRQTGGVNVWVARTTLDANGLPVLPFVHSLVTNANEDPNDLRLIRLHAGNLKNRIALTWTGSDPSETNPDAVSWSRVAYLDPPYAGPWTVQTIQKNQGTTADPCRIARVSFPLFRAAPGVSPNGQLIYVWESLLNSGGCGTLTGVHSYAKVSTDGGATWGSLTQVFPPPGNSNFYFFPNGYVDQNDVAWAFVYWRTPTGNDRDLTVRLFDDAGWSSFPRNDYTILDTGDNVQWPAVYSTSEGGGNRVYVSFTRDNLQADLKMYLMYTQGNYSSTVIPRDYRDPGATSCGAGCTLSVDFSAPTGSGLKGPLGTSVSNANYNRRPILNIVNTNDGIVWLPHMENANPYGTPNLWTYYSGDGFTTSPVTILTADAFAKGHQMASTLTSGARNLVYEVYHSSRGTVTDVNYEVYLIIYFNGWPSAADTLGPLVSSVAGTPNPVNRTATFRLTANLNDITTGNSDIAAAEYAIDAPASPGTGIAMAAVDTFNSPTEAAFADIDVGALGWADAECHFIYVRGQDAAGNWGSAEPVEQCTDEGNVDRIPPVAPVLLRAELAPGIADVTVTWNQASDEGTAGGTVEYRVYRATGLGGALAQVATVPAAGAGTYTYLDAGAGDGDPNVYRYRISSADAAGNEAQSIARAGKYTRTLPVGWQLVSVPLMQADSSIGKVFQTLSWTRARTYVASDTADPWKAYVQGKPYNDFTTVDINRAVWIMVSVPNDAFVVAGLVPTGVTIQLQQGWNFVGFPTFRSTPYTVADLKSAVPAVTAVEGYDTLGPYFLRRMLDTERMEQAFGYWVYATAPATWTVP